VSAIWKQNSILGGFEDEIAPHHIDVCRNPWFIDKRLGSGPSLHKSTFDFALTMAQAERAKCHADGHKISVLVVDTLNVPIVMLRDDGSVYGDRDGSLWFTRPMTNGIAHVTIKDQ
jgi:hypothetical protein